MALNIIKKDEDQTAQGQTPSGGSSQPVFTGGNPGQSFNDQVSKPTKGSGFTNIQRIAKANQPGQLGQTIGQGIKGIAQKTQSQLGQATSNFQQGAQANRLGTQQDVANRTATLNRVSQGDAQVAPTEQELSVFDRYRRGAYEGPQRLENTEQLQGQAQQAEQLAQATRSTGGRQSLLQRFVGTPQYTQGQQRLDNVLLGLGGNDPLKQARRSAIGLGQQVNTQTTAAEQQGQILAEQAKQFGQGTLSEVQSRQKVIDDQLTANLVLNQAQEQIRKQRMNDIQSLLQGKGMEAIKDPVTGEITRTGRAAASNNLDDINEALKLAQESGYLGSDQISSITDLQRKLATPIQKMYRQQVNVGPSGYLGYGGAAPGQQFQYAGDYKYSGLKLGDLLAGGLKREEGQNLTKEGIINDVERARYNSLAKLGAFGTDYDPTDKRFVGSKAAFDFAKANADVDKDIAKLRGESIEDLPSEYYDVPVTERLRRTLAPTATEASQDVVTDMKTALGSDISTWDRAKAGLSVAQTPWRAGLGIGTSAGLNTLNSGNTALGNMLSLDPSRMATGTLQGGLLFPKVALDATTDVLGGVSNIVKEVPLVGNIANSLVLKPIQSVMAPVSNAVSSFFCYATGTPIKMKDGSYKNVEKIKVGDILFLGGEVSAAGTSMSKDVYEYKGTKIDGGHAVFEDNEFIRVRDSQYAKKLKNTDDVRLHPIVSENHLMVTKSHISADLLEVDGETGKTEEERLVELNNQQGKLKKLKQLNAVLFNERKKV